MDATRIGKAKVPDGTRCEIARSFSYKLNVGQYESRDFFCSQKLECRIEDAEDISERLYQFCKSQVLKSVSDYKATASQPVRMSERKVS